MDIPHVTNFTIDDIKKALTTPLPGIIGQMKMAPAPVKGKLSRWATPPNYKEAGVLLLLYPHATNGAGPQLHTVFMRRPEYVGAHSGQISFPGGQRESGESLQHTALREMMEEVGVLPETVTIVGQLSALYTPPSNFYIYPFVAFSQTRPIFKSNSREVAELIEVPLSLLVNPDVYKEEIWQFDQYGERKIPFFAVFGHKIWGATAMILSEFLTLLVQLDGSD